MDYKIHDDIPSGFGPASDLEAARYRETGSINGAAKVAFVRSEIEGADPLVFVRFRPPRVYGDIQGESGNEPCDWYRAEYEKGWLSSKRGSGHLSPVTSVAYDDGFLDRTAQRPKWHLAYCTDHDLCKEL